MPLVNRGKSRLEYYDFTQSDDTCLLTNLALYGAVTGADLDWESSNYQNYRAPAIIQLSPNMSGDYYPGFYQVSVFNGSALEQTAAGSFGVPNYILIADSPYPAKNIYSSVLFEKFAVGQSYTIATDSPYAIGEPSFDYQSILTIDRLFGEPYANESGLATDNHAWLSYDVTSGTNTKKVFAYSITILDDLSGISGTNLNDASTLPPRLLGYAPKQLTGFCTAVNLLLGHSGFCLSPEPQDEPTQECLSGTPVTQDTLQLAISGAIQSALTKQRGQQINGSNNDLQNTSIGADYSIYTGAIQLNNPIPGDIIQIFSYNYPDHVSGYYLDYSGIYGHLPPYAQFEFDFVWGSTFTDAATLAHAINSELKHISYPIWANLDCTHNDGEGFFPNGPLLKAFVIDDNTVGLEALRIGELGNFFINIITAGARPAVIEPVNILKYLLPKTIILQGANTYGDWTDLDVQSGVDWTNIKPIQIIQKLPGPVASGNQTPPPPNDAPPIGASGEGVKQLLYTLNVTGLDRCGKPFTDTTEFYQGDPLNGCANPDDKDKDPLDNLLGQLGGAEIQQVVASYLKTGWKFNNPNDYNFYRIYFQDFYNSTAGLNVNLSNEFSIANVNFYGTISGYAPYSGDMCVIGSNYQVHVEGITSGIITGKASGYADDDTSGVFCFDGMLVTGTPNESSAFATGIFHLHSIPKDGQFLQVPVYGSYDIVETDADLNVTYPNYITISGINTSPASGTIFFTDKAEDGDILVVPIPFVGPKTFQFLTGFNLTGDYYVNIYNDPSSQAFGLYVALLNIPGINLSLDTFSVTITTSIPTGVSDSFNGEMYTTCTGAAVEGLTGCVYEYTNLGLSGVATGFFNYFNELGLSPVWHNLGISGYSFDLMQPYGGESGNGPFINGISGSGIMDGISYEGFTGGFGAFSTIPNGEVFFQKTFGQPTTPFTGVLAGCETGVDFYVESVGGYFYDPVAQSIYFSELVSGEITGQGVLIGGPYNIVDSGYLQSGITDTQFVVTSGLFTYTGFIPNFDFPFTNRQGFSYLSGSVTQVIISGGCALIQASITGTVTEAWQFGATGYNNSTGALYYNTPAVFDSIAINGIPITYATGDLFEPTSYYNNIDTLVNIINSGEDVFMVRATKMNSGLVRLDSLLSGSSGNQISLSSDGSDNKPRFDARSLYGGIDYFAPMTPRTPFTGQLSMNLCATAYMVAPASGTITGDIAQVSYYRTFTGVWNLVTGQEDFSKNGWLTNPTTYGNSPTTFVSTPTYFSIAVDYDNVPTEVSPDFAILTISGVNFPTGIQFILSGKY